MKDAIASYQILIDLFERIAFFLQRLENFAAVQLTPELTVSLARLMAEVLSILAFSTKVMKEGRTSGFISLMHTALAEHDTEKFMKRVIGRTDVEDALQQLNMLTHESLNLMATATTSQVAHQVHEIVTEIKEVVHDVGDNAKATRKIADRVYQNVWVIPFDLADGVSDKGKGESNNHSIEGTGPSA